MVDPGGLGVKRYPNNAIGRAQALRRNMTVSERRLWRALRRLDLGFRRQVPIGRYVVDFACLRARLVVEIDGYWHEQPDAKLRDQTRDDWLRREGYRVIRFADLRVFNETPTVVEAILEALPPQGGKGWDGGARAEFSGLTLEAEPPHAPLASASRGHPHPCPAPLEGAGTFESDEGDP